MAYATLHTGWSPVHAPSGTCGPALGTGHKPLNARGPGKNCLSPRGHGHGPARLSPGCGGLDDRDRAQPHQCCLCRGVTPGTPETPGVSPCTRTERAMTCWLVVLLLLMMLGCAHHEPPPPVPPPPEDLSTWSVPELVQPPPPAPPPVPPGVEKDKPTAAERVYDFLPGTTFTVSIATAVPLDLLLEPGED